MDLKTRRPSLLPLDIVHHGRRGGQFTHGGMVAASLGNGGPNVFWDPCVASFGARGMVHFTGAPTAAPQGPMRWARTKD